jgi:hypothetical protein
VYKPNNPTDFFINIVANRPALPSMSDSEVERLVSVLEGLQVYLDERKSPTPCEKKLGFNGRSLLREYRYLTDPTLRQDDLDYDGESVYEYLVENY